MTQEPQNEIEESSASSEDSTDEAGLAQSPVLNEEKLGEQAAAAQDSGEDVDSDPASEAGEENDESRPTIEEPNAAEQDSGEDVDSDPASEAGEENDESRPTILVIDDSRTARRAMSIYLSKHGYHVLAVEDGFAAIRALTRLRPIIVFADIMMPRIDGYEFSILLNNNPKLQDIPIVLVSSKDHVFSRARAKVTGCKFFIRKPFTEQQLLDCIEKFAITED